MGWATPMTHLFSQMMNQLIETFLLLIQLLLQLLLGFYKPEKLMTSWGFSFFCLIWHAPSYFLMAHLDLSLSLKFYLLIIFLPAPFPPITPSSNHTLLFCIALIIFWMYQIPLLFVLECKLYESWNFVSTVHGFPWTGHIKDM